MKNTFLWAIRILVPFFYRINLYVISLFIIALACLIILLLWLSFLSRFIFRNVLNILSAPPLRIALCVVATFRVEWYETCDFHLVCTLNLFFINIVYCTVSITCLTGVNHPFPPSSQERYVTIKTGGFGWSKLYMSAH